MSLQFPNSSRSYDPDRQRIRFWGYDNALEVPFFIEVGALCKLYPRTENGEASILASFDAGLERILSAAQKIYAPRQRRAFYVLAATDF